VCEHFSNQLPNGKKVHFFISQAAYRAYDGSTGYEAGVGEIQKQIDVNRANLSSGYTGSVFYNTTAYNKMYLELKASHFQDKALPPAMDWKVNTTLEAPTNLALSGSTLTWQHPTEERFTVYAFPASIETKIALTNPAYLRGIVWGKSVNISSFGDLKNTTIAVVTYDRFGVEHGVAIYSPKPDITWVLNGGELPVVEIPTNEELWQMFKTDFDAFHAERIPGYVSGSDLPTTSILEYTWPSNLSEAIGMDFMNEHPNWLWLKDYIQSVAGTISDLRQWRFNLYAFFNATDQVAYANGSVITWAECGNFTTAGQPTAWGPAYQAAKGAITLPDFVTTEYTLPTNITHPKGYPFLGWWDNASFSGAQLYTIPAYWKGTLYANWQATPTRIEYVLDMAQPMEIYDIMGRRLGTSLNQLQGNVFIIKQGNNTFKFVK